MYFIIYNKQVPLRKIYRIGSECNKSCCESCIVWKGLESGMI